MYAVSMMALVANEKIGVCLHSFMNIQKVSFEVFSRSATTSKSMAKGSLSHVMSRMMVK